MNTERNYNFDCCSDRRQSDAMKYRDLAALFGREDLLPMWIADMDFEVCPDITRALENRLAHHVYGYATVPREFYPTICQWLRRRHGFDVSEDEITFVPGVVRGIGYAVNRFCRPGDRVVIQPPVYHPFRMVVEGNDCIAVENPLVLTDEGYRMDLEGLRKIVAEQKPRMMILCNPHNPIGILWDVETLRAVADICAEAGVIVVSDEIHGDLALRGGSHHPFLSVSDNARRCGVMLGAPSKTFNIPGLVSSWCVVKDAELRSRLFDWMTVNEFNSPTFVATIGTIAAYTRGEQWLAEALGYIEDNIDHAIARIAEISGGRMKGMRPQASFLVWVDCRGLGLTHDELVKFFTDRACLALNDGAMFGSQGSGFMRFNVAAPRAMVDEALNRIDKALKGSKI